MKNDLRYGCGFHTPKNTKTLFSSKIGSSEIPYLLKMFKYIVILSEYDTNNYNFESFDFFQTRQNKFWYEFRYGVRRYGLWFSYPTYMFVISLRI